MNFAPYVVGIDFGTTSLSAVIVDIDKKEIVRVLNYNTNAYLDQSDARVKEQSVALLDKLFATLLEDIRGLCIEVKAFGFTGQMHGIVGVNSLNEAVTDLVTWEDKTGEMLLEDGMSIVDTVRKLTDDPTLSPGYGVVTLYKWLVVEGRKDIARFCSIADYFAARLAGKVVMSPSMAHSVGLFDIETDTWNEDAIEKAGLDFSVFPEIVPEASVIGRQDGAIVTSAVGDNQASFLGSVYDDPNSLLLNIGTGAQVSMMLPKSQKPEYEKYIDGFETQIRPYNEGFYLIAAGFINGGASYKALFNFFKECGGRLFQSDNIDEAALWDNMEKAGWAALQTEDLPNVSHLLSGERNCPDAKASIRDITPHNFHPGNFIAGYLSGMARYYKSAFPEELILKAEKICGSGNGLKRNELFVKIVEATFGGQVCLTPYNEEAAVGAALSAAKSLSADHIIESLNFSPGSLYSK